MKLLKVVICCSLVIVLYANDSIAQIRTIHVFVALCDNQNQGIVPVPEKLGNGQDPGSNLYWGAMYGVKSFFRRKTSDWELVQELHSENDFILERALFKYKSQNVFMLADAYDGASIKDSIVRFLLASNSQKDFILEYNSKSLEFGGKADLVAYVGHNGLMDFDVQVNYDAANKNAVDAIVLACYSKPYFKDHFRKSGANPILWSTHLMAPEAYSLDAAIRGWILNETDENIRERAAESYNKFQKCGINGARNLLVSGF